MNEPIMGPEIKAPPKVKFIIVIDDVAPLEKEIGYGWKIAQVYTHAQGALILLMK